MRVGRRRQTQRQQNLDLARRVGQMVVAAHHVRDLEVGVVEHGGEVVGRHAVGAKDNQVVQLAVLKDRMPLDQVFDDGLPLGAASGSE